MTDVWGAVGVEWGLLGVGAVVWGSVGRGGADPEAWDVLRTAPASHRIAGVGGAIPHSLCCCLCPRGGLPAGLLYQILGDLMAQPHSPPSRLCDQPDKLSRPPPLLPPPCI